MKKDRIKIVYEDKDILVVDKPCNLLSISTNNEKERTMFHKVFMYIKSKNKNNKIFIVHRLDKDTSGLLVFAKSEAVKSKLQDNWDNIVKKRGYVAVVEGEVSKTSETIKSYICETKTLLSYSGSKDNGKLAITKYNKLKTNGRYSLLDIEILTGRKNQIRVHMKDIGHAIVGDSKYGSKSNPIKRMGLHANVLEFVHPATNKVVRFESNVPKEFYQIVE